VIQGIRTFRFTYDAGLPTSSVSRGTTEAAMERTIARTVAVPGGFSPDRTALRRLLLWAELWSERRALRRLDTALLHDIGVSPDEAEREATRRPWDVPSARREG
jgi:uncharacterized protein YjiS (DUF1127 family)